MMYGIKARVKGYFSNPKLTIKNSKSVRMAITIKAFLSLGSRKPTPTNHPIMERIKRVILAIWVVGSHRVSKISAPYRRKPKAHKRWKKFLLPCIA